MKVYSLLIAFCAFQVLICSYEGVNQRKLQDAFIKALPHIKVTLPQKISIPAFNQYRELIFTLSSLNQNNVQIIMDEFGLIQFKYTNFNFAFSGRFVNAYLRENSPMKADVTDFCWEQTFYVKTKKLDNGKYSLNYKQTGDSEIKFNVRNVQVDIKKRLARKATTNTLPKTMKNFNFKLVKDFLERIAKLTFENLKKDLEK
jgi:hypothetical protein